MIDWNRVEKLLDASNYTHEKREAVIARLIAFGETFGEFEEAEYQMIIGELTEAGNDPITHGNNYNQSDIVKHLRKLS